MKAFLAQMSVSKFAAVVDDVDVINEITAFIIDDDKTTIDILVAATAGKPIMSQETAIKLSKMVDDPAAELAKLQAEAEAASNLDMFPTATGGATVQNA